MAEFRQVHCKTWRDDWFSELETDEKLLWLYLITNQATSVSGIYQLPRKFIAFETGLHIERVTEILEKFKDQQKIDFDDSVIWVCKMREYQSTSSDKVATRIRIDVDSIPNCRVKGIYCRKYGIDTVSIPIPQSSSDTDTETEKRRRRSDADKPRSSTPLQIQAYREVAHRYPNKSLYQMIVEAVPETDLDFYKQVVQAWIALGWNPSNIQGQLESYKRREIPHKNGHNGSKPGIAIDDEHAAALRNAYR